MGSVPDHLSCNMLNDYWFALRRTNACAWARSRLARLPPTLRPVLYDHQDDPRKNCAASGGESNGAFGGC
jgi:hypothetical protein